MWMWIVLILVGASVVELFVVASRLSKAQNLLTNALAGRLQVMADRLKAVEQGIQAVETCTNPQFRHHLQVVSPWPLQQLYSFSLTLKPQFWQNTLKVTAEEIANAAKWGGPLPRRVSIERWRSHRQVLLYGDGGNICPTRTLFLIEPVGMDAVPLCRIVFGSLLDEKWLELYLEDDSIRLGAVGGSFGHDLRHVGLDCPLYGPARAELFVDLPLRSLSELQKYRISSDTDSIGDRLHESDYEHDDDGTGVSWSLHVEDLRSLHESEIDEQYSET